MPFRPCNYASASLTVAFQRIAPSFTEYVHRPCTLVLHNGEPVERALCIEEGRGFHTSGWIHPDEVAEVCECKTRLPPHLATKLYRAGESGMGYLLFTLELYSGADFVYVIGGGADFLDLPEGATTADIKDVHPHEGRERANRDGYRGSAVYRLCYYLPAPGTA